MADEPGPDRAAGDDPEDGAGAKPDPLAAHPLAAEVVARFPGAVGVLSRGQPVVHVDRDRWAEVVAWLKSDQDVSMCLDVTAVDHLVNPARTVPDGVAPERFEVVANLIAMTRNFRLRLVCQVPGDDPEVPSLTGSFPGVSVGEREVYDLMGITFRGHDDLTRILMPDDWVGHPLRKDDAPSRVPVQFKGVPRPA